VGRPPYVISPLERSSTPSLPHWHRGGARDRMDEGTAKICWAST